MRITLAELQSYSHCPILYSKGVDVENPLPAPIATIKRLLLYMYSRQLEEGYKISYDEIVNGWNRYWWSSRDLDDSESRQESNSAMVGINQLFEYYRSDQRIVLAVNLPFRLNIKSDVICGIAPLILCDPDNHRKITLLDMGLRTNVRDITRSLDLRIMSLVVEEHLGFRPSVIEKLYFDKRYSLRNVCIYPTESFQQLTAGMVTGLLNAIKEGVIYPNSFACEGCIMQTTCMI